MPNLVTKPAQTYVAAEALSSHRRTSPVQGSSSRRQKPSTRQRDAESGPTTAAPSYGKARRRFSGGGELPSPEQVGFVAVIYDTCFLMKNRTPLTSDWLLQIEQDWYALLHYGERFGKMSADDRRLRLSYFLDPAFNNPLASTLPVSHIVPQEVKSELTMLLSGGAAAAARGARKTVARLVDERNYYEPRLAGRSLEAEIPCDALGADSRTDRLLIHYARHLARQMNRPLVLIATDDGGIMYDVATLRRKTGLPIYCVSHPHDVAQQAPLHQVFDRAQRARETAQAESDFRRTVNAIRNVSVAAAAVVLGIATLFCQF